MNEELETTLGSILSDPQQMERLRAMAQSLMGAPPQGPEEAASSAPKDGLLGLLGKTAGSGRASESEQLLRAMKPYMRPKRRTKIERALKITRLLSVAGAVLEQYGGEFDGL